MLLLIYNINSVDKTKLTCYTSPLMQPHSFLEIHPFYSLWQFSFGSHGKFKKLSSTKLLQK